MIVKSLHASELWLGNSVTVLCSLPIVLVPVLNDFTCQPLQS